MLKKSQRARMLVDTPCPAGLYIHVPFCLKRCPYCDFYSTTQLDFANDFVEALLCEISLRADASKNCDTLYFGGGTPSLLSHRAIRKIIRTIRQSFAFAKDAEITLEANPGTVSAKRLKGYRRAGVNRLNIGFQSLCDGNLNFLKRIHSIEDALQAFHIARESGFNNIGIDLIYGLPEQTTQIWQEELAEAIMLSPEHFSCYTLTFEENTPMGRQGITGNISPLPEKKIAEMIILTINTLRTAGYKQYEISNFSKNGAYPSRHNQKYWSMATYFGFGPSAHSFEGKKRWWNRSNLFDYINNLKSKRLPVDSSEELTKTQQGIEVLMLALRTTKGVTIKSLPFYFDDGQMMRARKEMQRLVKEGLARLSPSYFRLTATGFLFVDEIVRRLVFCLPEEGS